jgi:flagellar basal-body rod protein FlgB
MGKEAVLQILPIFLRFKQISPFFSLERGSLAWHGACEVRNTFVISTFQFNMNAVPRYDPLTFGETALKLRSHRHELLASNLVNADTPHFKARDIDFPQMLEMQMQGKTNGKTMYLDRTHQAHLPGMGVSGAAQPLFRVPVQPAVDGNTVDPDLERGHFVKNAMMTETTLSFLGSTLRTRLSAITGQPS